MTNTTSKEQRELDRLADALVDDIFNASDEEIMSELAESATAVEDVGRLKEFFENALVRANKRRLVAAKAGATANRDPIMRAVSPVVDIATARARIRGLVGATDLPQPITMAARNEDELSDADILSMYEDLVELGALPPTTSE